MNPIAWISITAGLLAITVFALNAMRIMRKRERTYTGDENAARTPLEKIDEAADSALNEINNTARLALDEINEKYQAIMFLYSLLDEKKKEISMLQEQVVNPGHKPGQETTGFAAVGQNARSAAAKKPRPASPGRSARYDKVITLSRDGLSVSEIAKQLSIGQGEVQLTLDLANRK